MKKIILLISIAIPALQLSAQVHFTRYSQQPVIGYDTTYMWESIGQPSVIYENDSVKMWYAVGGPAYPGDTVLRGRIHYAYSADGYHFTKYPGNPVFVPPQDGSWDDENYDTPEILRDGPGYKLYYFGDSMHYAGPYSSALGMAESIDGIHWTRISKVLERGALGDWDGCFVESPAMYKDPVSGLYGMWYMGIDTGWTSRLYVRIGLAVSMDGQNFFKYPGPVCIEGNPGEWDDMWVGAPAVLRSQGILEMWYSGCPLNYTNDTLKVGYALSLDGARWIKYPGNPVTGGEFPGDTTTYWGVDVVFDSTAGNYKLYYENDYVHGAVGIFATTAPRDVFLSPACNVSCGSHVTITQGDTIQMSASGGTHYQWNPTTGLSNPNIANPLASPDTSTTYTVLVVSTTCIDTCFVQVTVNPVGMNEVKENSIQVFPSPAQSIVNISFSYPVEKDSRISVYDITGQKVFETRTESDTRKVTLNIASLKPGLYLLHVTGKEDFSAKFIKQ